jgi:coenzyme F420 biosynthesis associated uncharacterized protein
MVSLIDWRLAARTAGQLIPTAPSVSAQHARDVVADLTGAAKTATQHVAELTRLIEPPVTAITRVVDRRGWVDVNAQGMSAVMEPLVNKLIGVNPPSKLAASVGAKVTGAQAGAILAFMSGKVLGQFEFFARDGGQLLLVAPNIVSVEQSLGVDPADFRLWVCLHEVTHRVQFTAVPWMRAHMLTEISSLVDGMDTDSDALRERVFNAVGAMARSVRERRKTDDSPTDDGTGGMIDLLTTPEQRLILDRMTGFMSLVEGHAEYVMNAVDPSVIPSQKQIERRFARRRLKGGNPLDRLMRRLLGLDAKARQYTDGSAFVRGVVAKVGIDGFNAIWTSPDTLPSKAEIREPDQWVARVHG